VFRNAIAALFLAFCSMSFAKTAEFTFSPHCTLTSVLNHLHLKYDPSLVRPEIVLQSEIPFSEFQDLIEKKWNLRPKGFLNIYMPKENKIFLVDDIEYYQKTGRFMDDSLAHEFTHYIQVVYQKTDLDGSSDKLEQEAIDVQNWYRESFLNTQKSPCEKSHKYILK
tara:strand:+ start:246 stop:743 length:498 start_codon:yes stop_codon:yes gene_type:complete